MKLHTKKITDYVEEQCWSSINYLCSGRGGHVTKYKIKDTLLDLQREIINKIKLLAEEDEILSSINSFYIKGNKVQTTAMACNIINRLINSTSESVTMHAEEPSTPYIKAVQEIQTKQGTHIYKVTLQPKSKLSFQEDNKTLSCGQLMMKNLKFSNKIRQEYGSFHVEREIPSFLKKDHQILVKQQRIFKLVDKHKHTAENNQSAKPIKTKIFIAENHQMTLAVETRTNEDGSTEWTNYTVKDLYPLTPIEIEIESTRRRKNTLSISDASSTKSD